jgi:hypothetical protein
MGPESPESVSVKVSPPPLRLFLALLLLGVQPPLIASLDAVGGCAARMRDT